MLLQWKNRYSSNQIIAYSFSFVVLARQMVFSKNKEETYYKQIIGKIS